MKRIVSVIFALTVAVTLSACQTTLEVTCNADGHGNPAQQAQACADR